MTWNELERIGVRPLTHQAVRDDIREQRHNIQHRAEYHAHPYQPTEPDIPMHAPLNSLVLPRPSQMQAMSATQNHPDWQTQEIARGAQNQADIAAALHEARSVAEDRRPIHTKNQYHSKQKVWDAWCVERDFPDKNTVTEGKLVLWLTKVIVPNGNRGVGPNKGSMLSTSGLDGYVKPIIALWEVPIVFLVSKY
jgi:hypothetical protein